jgi:uncharacterized protein YneF (UPF0154 family)
MEGTVVIVVVILIIFNISTLIAGYFLLMRSIEKRLVNNRVLDAVKKEINSMIIQLNETTVQNISLLEERVDKVHKLLAMADRKINELDSSASSESTYKQVKRAKKKQEKESEPILDNQVDQAGDEPGTVDISLDHSSDTTFKDLFSEHMQSSSDNTTYNPKKIVKQTKKSTEINDKDHKVLEEALKLDSELAAMTVPERVRCLKSLGWDRTRIQKKTGLSPGELELLLNIEETLSD